MDSDTTVVVITRNRRTRLLETLDRLHGLPDRPAIVVVDNASQDDTIRCVTQRFPSVQLLPLRTNVGAAGRTVGVAAARTEVVAFSDDDSWWSPGALRTAADRFTRDPALGLVAARTVVFPDGRDDPINDALRRFPVMGFLACAAVVRRSAYLAVGGFCPSFVMGAEEGLLALDLRTAGWGLQYEPDVVACHEPATTGDRGGRRTNQLRNELWTAWLRYPAATAARETALALRRAATDRDQALALMKSLAGVRWVAQRRRPVPSHVAALLGATTLAAV